MSWGERAVLARLLASDPPPDPATPEWRECGHVPGYYERITEPSRAALPEPLPFTASPQVEEPTAPASPPLKLKLPRSRSRPAEQPLDVAGE